VFQSELLDTGTLSDNLSDLVLESHGFQANVLILQREDLEQTIRQNPFPEARDDHKSLHFWFLKIKPDNPDIPAIESLKSQSEQFLLNEKVFYLFAPKGIGRSKLAEKVERHLGVPATARNWRSVSRFAEIIQGYD
jgi:uncharacterized protein (DUF1697 family)